MSDDPISDAIAELDAIAAPAPKPAPMTELPPVRCDIHVRTEIQATTCGTVSIERAFWTFHVRVLSPSGRLLGEKLYAGPPRGVRIRRSPLDNHPMYSAADFRLLQLNERAAEDSIRDELGLTDPWELHVVYE